uniref:Transmembrane protein 222 n=1 Tax=Rhizochromulina marina TaxID=1034831 RepID=A0A7S2SRK7_9STRA|mmetsp:Transcript_5399/g.15886  ORF Transcript_5399/g.15886 Transcript_5399/m.15886 type:complete len:208 (+) Transcript_5399:78-701(+)
MWGMGGFWRDEHRQLVASLPAGSEAKIDRKRHRYPYAIVWTPIHPISWVLPFVGHMGVCDSRGICLDFTGAIGVDDLAFGKPTRFLVLNPKRVSRDRVLAKTRGLDLEAHALETENTDEPAELWDRAVLHSCEDFQHRMHCMICGSDCHSHVAVALNAMGYLGFTWWNKVILAAWIFFCGRYTSIGSFIQTWLGTAVVLVIALFVNS